ncbi:MAG: endonuclease III [Ignavibacteria bacterium]|nr:endonuclease III [Ignavibacteria bacterium]
MKQTIPQLKSTINSIITKLEIEYPDAQCALLHDNPFQLLIATILSAQCTDERVNIVTRTLFQKFPSPQEFADVPIEELEKEIYSTGFYKAKAKNIQACCRQLLERFDGEIPRTMDELHSLPGVGRKTANVVLGNAFGIAAGVTVDTHVTRVCHLLGLTEGKNAEAIERELMEIVPQEKWTSFTHLIISHGRTICIARRPKCSECVLNIICPSSLI